jgi:hypothetical protein
MAAGSAGHPWSWKNCLTRFLNPPVEKKDFVLDMVLSARSTNGGGHTAPATSYGAGATITAPGQRKPGRRDRIQRQPAGLITRLAAVESAEKLLMDDHTRVPAFSVYRVTLAGLIPLTRYYSCIHCEHDLTDWVMKQSTSEPSTCPNCEVRIDERDIAGAQRDTKFGCLWTLASIAALILATAAIVGVIWLFTGPQPLIRFR